MVQMKEGESMTKPETMRLSITLTTKQHDKIKAAADELGLSISAYLSVAAAEKIKRDARTKTE